MLKRTDSQRKADQRYKEKAKAEGRRAHILLDLPTDEKEQIDAYCKLKGEKRHTFIRRAIREAMERDPIVTEEANESDN